MDFLLTHDLLDERDSHIGTFVTRLFPRKKWDTAIAMDFSGTEISGTLGADFGLGGHRAPDSFGTNRHVTLEDKLVCFEQ